MPERCRVILPILTIEGFNAEGTEIEFKNTPCIDTDPIGIGSGHIKALNPTPRTEEMFGNTGVERITGQCFLT